MSDDIVKCEQSSLSRQSFLEGIGCLEATDLFPDSWSMEEKQAGASELAKKPVGAGLYQKIPRRCKGADCPDLKNCSLPKRPINDRCPYEVAILEALLVKYIQNLRITDDDITAYSLVRDLVDIEIQTMRLQGEFSEDPSFTMEVEIPVGDSFMTQIVENPRMNSADRLSRRKAAILKQLAATREQHLKLVGDVENRREIARVAEIMERFASRVKIDGGIDRVDNDSELVDSFIDAEFEIIDDEA